jgi:YjjG family noncanonical pyrimidine nucleotidase
LNIDNYTHLLIDLDHTIFDFDASQKIALEKAIEKQGIQFSDDHAPIYYRINRLNWELYESGKITRETLEIKRFQDFKDESGLPVNVLSLKESYYEHIEGSTHMFDGAMDFLKSHKRNKHLTAVTNGIPKLQRGRLRKSGLDNVFNSIIISGEIGYVKPDRKYFEKTFHTIGNPKKNNVLMIGDSLVADISGALQFGLKCVWYNPHSVKNHTSFVPTYEVKSFSDFSRGL